MSMVGFEVFNPSSWVSDGLVCKAPRTVKRNASKLSGMAKAAVISLAAVASNGLLASAACASYVASLTDYQFVCRTDSNQKENIPKESSIPVSGASSQPPAAFTFELVAAEVIANLKDGIPLSMSDQTLRLADATAKISSAGWVNRLSSDLSKLVD